MQINRNKLAKKVIEGEITSLVDRNPILRSMIKDVVDTAMELSARYIQHHVREIDDHDIFPETVSRITDAITAKAANTSSAIYWFTPDPVDKRRHYIHSGPSAGASFGLVGIVPN